MINYQLFDTLLEPVFVLNKNKGVVYANDTAAIISSQNLRRLIKNQTSFDQIFKFNEPLEFLNELEKITEPTPYKELNFTNCSDEQGKVQITVQRMYFNTEEAHWIVFFRDVTLEERLQKKYKAELESKESYILELQKAKAELENYSQNLEKMVSERTAELSQLNQTLSALLNSLGQGFFIFDQDGQCHDVYSKACLELLEAAPAKKKVWDVLHLPENKVSGFQKWMMTAFSEMLPFEDLAPLAPQDYAHSEKRNIQLEYFPLRSEDTVIQSIVVMATDKTALIAAQKEAEAEKNKVQQILKIIQNKKQIPLFISETKSQLDQLLNIKKNWQPNDLESLKRILHTLKGNAALYNIQPLADKAHHLETKVAEDIHFASQNWSDDVHSMNNDFQDFLNLKNELINDRENDNSNFRVEDFFLPFDSEMKKISTQLGKKVKPLSISTPPQLQLDETQYASLFSSMIHFIRNSLDHGIESPELRIQKGKSPEGEIKIALHNKADLLEIHVSDDGAGLNFDKLRQKAQERGLPSAQMNQEQLSMLIFEAAFSTQDQVSELSGRGVGLDAVKDNVTRLKGHITVETKKDFGTLFKITVPLFEKNLASAKAA